MFTGIIEEKGIVHSIRQGQNSARLVIYASKVLEGLHIGDSINTNGSCLTVVHFDHKGFEVDIMAETMRRTNLHLLKNGSIVNLERALQLNSRLGGHMVSGHIDGTGVITKFTKEDISTWITIKADKEIMRYIIHKGSIALDGVSLTVASLTADEFSVSIIPHTSHETTLLKKKPGDLINIECDLIGKYVEKFILKQDQDQHNQIDYNFLKKHGFTD